MNISPRLFALAPLLLAVMTLSAPAAVAQDVLVSGRMSALSFVAMDKSRPVMVRLYDDSPANQDLKVTFERSLRDAGYTVQEDAQLVLSFDVRNQVDASALQDLGRLEITGQNQGYTGGEEYVARYELFSSRQDQKGVAYPEGNMRLDVAITDRENGRRVWQGWADVDTTGQEARDVSPLLVPPLVSVIGQTVRDKALN